MEYALELENRLNISHQIDGCEKLFKKFVSENSLEINCELSLLRVIKLFLHKEKDQIRRNNKGSNISNYDCLTLAIIACALSGRNGYTVHIGRPDLLSRYYHSVIIRSNGSLFKITGKRRNYGYKILTLNTVERRLNSLKPIISFFDKIKMRK